MFANFIYFIVVLLIYSTYQPPEQTNFAAFDTFSFFVGLIIAFSLFCRYRFYKIAKKMHRESFTRMDHLFTTTVTRLSVLAVLLFTFDIYALSLPAYFSGFWLFSTIPTLQALCFLALFVFYLVIVWSEAHNVYRRLYAAEISKKSYIVSNISFSIPVLLPWLILSGVSDIVFALPFAYPKAFLETTEGQVSYFLVFLLAVAVFGPVMIQKFWRCRPLEDGFYRHRIEKLCERAELQVAEILYWPIFGGRMITAGVMGLVKRFRYILVTRALLQYLKPEEIDAVMAHEIGHVKKKHILFYLVFFAGYMLISYATFDLIIYFMIFAEPVFTFINASGLNQSTVTSVFFTLATIIIFLVYFRFIFGYFMRNFERQADCYVYSLYNSAAPLISTLEKIAITSGQPPDKPNWHHFSIAERIDYLKKCEQDISWVRRQDRKIFKSIAIYLAGIFLIGAVGYTLNFSAAGKRLSARFFETIIERELESDPKNANLYRILGDLYFARNHREGVQWAYETALSLEPDNAHALNNLAWLYATSEDLKYRDHARALALARKAAAIDSSPHILDTLAESYHVNGMHAEAVKTARKALEKAKQDKEYFQKQLEKFEKAAESSP